jgi:hypothetical protein
MKYRKTQPVALAFIAITILSVSGLAGAGPRIKICTHWRSKYTDSGVGEDVFTSIGYLNRNAAYARAELSKKNSSSGPVWGSYLDESGCTPYIDVESNTAYDFGQATSASRHGRFFYVNKDGYSYGTSKNWIETSFTTDNLGNSDHTIEIKPSNISRQINIMPVIGKILSKYSELNLPPCSTYIQTAYHSSRCKIGSYTPGTKNVCLLSNEGVNRTAQKFRATHEFGHRQADAAEGPNPHDYAHDNSNDYFLCSCRHVDTSPPEDSPNQIPRTYNSHCLQSKEDIDDAAGEGYAHFWSAAVFNNRSSSSCGFGYYKELKIGPQSVEYPTVEIDCTDHKKHLNSWCGSTSNWRKGTEWDWLTFYWNLWTNGSDKLSMSQIDGMWNPNSSTKTWSEWYYNILGNYGQDKANHFYNTGHDAGVIH